MEKYTLKNERALELVHNIKNGIDIEKSYNELVIDSGKMRDWFRRKYLPIVMKYDLDFDDVEQEMLMSLVKAVENCPIDCADFVNYLFPYYRGACLNYFKNNTNRIMKHSEDKEKRLLEFETISLNRKSEITENVEFVDILVDENSEQSFNSIIDKNYFKYVLDKLKNYLLIKFKNINVDLYFDFYRLTFDELETKYHYPMLNIVRYCNYITTVLKTSSDFQLYCEKYLIDELIERRMNKYNYLMYSDDIIDVKPILEDDIITEYSNTTMLSYEVNKDVKIHNYFRVRFNQQFCV